MKLYTALIIIMTIFTTNAFASSSEKERVNELEKICIQAKNEILYEKRERKIKTCIEVDKRDEAYCRRFFKDFGAGNNAPATLRNKLRQLPECIEAFNARKNLKR